MIARPRLPLWLCFLLALMIVCAVSGMTAGVAQADVPQASSPTQLTILGNDPTIGTMVICNGATWDAGSESILSIRRDGNIIVSASAGENSLLYVLTAEDVGHLLDCRSVATNADGSNNEDSQFIEVAVPVIITAPSISPGQAAINDWLTCSPGMWTSTTNEYGYEWLRDGDTILGETTSVYLVRGPDSGHSITCRVSMLAPAQLMVIALAESAPVLVAAPGIVTPPTVYLLGGTSYHGETLECLQGTWTGSGYEFRYQWLLGGSLIDGDTSYLHTVTAADLGQQISCRVTLVTGDVVIASGDADPVPALAPIVLTDPSVYELGGSADIGETLECLPGQWTGTAYDFSYQWLRDGTPVLGETDYLHTVAPADLGHDIACHVALVAAPGGEIIAGADAPALRAGISQLEAPSVYLLYGSSYHGDLLDCLSGRWSGAGYSFSYQWFSDGGFITGETSYLHTITAADLGTQISCRVTLTVDGAVVGMGDSEAVPALAPVALIDPSVYPLSGSADIGETLECMSGQWTGSGYSFAYQWLRDGTPVLGETDYLHTVAPADLGHDIACHVALVADPGGEIIAGADAPALRAGISQLEAPSIYLLYGSSYHGDLLDCLAGRWSGAGYSFSYQWLSDGGLITGETSYLHTITAADLGAQISCRVTLTVDDTVVGMGESDAVPALAPIPTFGASVYELAGNADLGATLECLSGTWTGSGYGFSYQWFAGGQPIGGATDYLHTITPSDMGQQVTCHVALISATEGATIAGMDAPPVAALAPVATVAPSIYPLAGTSYHGDTLDCLTGSWTGSGYAFAYQWLAGGVPIIGATDYLLTLRADQMDKQITCRVSLTVDETIVASADSEPVPGLTPIPIVAPSVYELNDGANVGATLDCLSGSWTGSGYSFSYQWLRDGAAIDGATNYLYTIDVADSGKHLDCRLSLDEDGTGISLVRYDAPGPVAQGAVMISPTTLSASDDPATINTELSCTAATWTPAPQGVTIVWLRDGAELDAQGSSYTAVAADIGHAIACRTDGRFAIDTDSSVSDQINVTAPVARVAPSIDGSGYFTNELVCRSGAWAGSGYDFAYAWTLDDVQISTGQTLQLSSSELQQQVRCTVSLMVGPDQIANATTDPVTVTGPELVEVPAVTGGDQLGSQVSCEGGMWTPKDGYDRVYSWLRNGQVLVGGDADTHTIVGADLGQSLSCHVVLIATDDAHAQLGEATSPDFSIPAPQLTVQVTPNDATVDAGTALSCQGTIDVPEGQATYSYEWVGGSDGGTLETGQTHTAAVSDESFNCVVMVIASDSTVIASASSPVQSVRAPLAFTASPTISGDPTVGQTLTCLPGTLNTEATVTYTWSADGTIIEGATTSTLLLTPDQAGSMIVCLVHASSGDQAADAQSEPIGPVQALVAPDGPNPMIVGTSAVGQTLTCDAGAWTGSGPITLDYTWLRGELTISLGPTYELTAQDAGTQIFCRVHGVGPGGEASKGSQAQTVAPAPDQAPVLIAQPRITGAAAVGSTLTCLTGTWGGTQPITEQVAWLRAGIVVPGESAAMYLVSTADAGSTITCRVVATNRAGSLTAYADPVGPVASNVAPVAGTVELDGAATSGQSLTCVPLGWRADELLSYTWLRDGSPISAARGAVYTLTDSDAGHLVACRVTGVTAAGSASAQSLEVRVAASSTPTPIPPTKPVSVPKPTPFPPMLPNPTHGACTIIGTRYADHLVGTPGDDVICALGGNDVVEGLGGNDVIFAGSGNDRVDGGPGNDRIFGASGADILRGGSGNDWILGHSGADFLDGGSGADRLDGGSGSDILRGGLGSDTMLGGRGNDELHGGRGNDRITGGVALDPIPGVAGGEHSLLAHMRIADGNDEVWGDSGNDIVEGGTGNDHIWGGSGNDRIYGGAGSDRLHGGTGDDTFYRSPGCDRWQGDEGSDRELIIRWLARTGCSGTFGGV